MAQAIAQHLAGAVAAGFDQQALLGDEGFFDSSSGPLTEPSAPGSATTAAQYSEMLDRHRSMVGTLRMSPPSVS